MPCAAVQPHWGWRCTRPQHDPAYAHVSTWEDQVMALWWDPWEPPVEAPAVR